MRQSESLTASLLEQLRPPVSLRDDQHGVEVAGALRKDCLESHADDEPSAHEPIRRRSGEQRRGPLTRGRLSVSVIRCTFCSRALTAATSREAAARSLEGAGPARLSMRARRGRPQAPYGHSLSAYTSVTNPPPRWYASPSWGAPTTWRV